MKISVVIPAWNEKGNVEALALRFDKIFWNLNIDYELIYILRGTPDQSGYNNLMTMTKALPKLKPIYADNVRGYANSSCYGFSLVAPDSDFVLTMDADQNHSPEEISKFLYHKEDIIIGSRYLDNKFKIGPLWKRTLSKLMNQIMTMMFGLKVKDKTSGYRLYRKSVLDDIYTEHLMDGFEFLPELLMIANRKGYTMKEIPITFTARTIGESKMDVIKSIKGYLKLLWGRVCYRKNTL